MNHMQGNGIGQARALAWEFWAHGWRGQLLGLAGVVGFASLLYGAFALQSDISFRGTEAGTAMHFGLFWVTLFFLGAPILTVAGAPQRRYTLPTSSLLLVACPMVYSMVSTFVLYAMAATTLNLLFDAGWPIWGPGLVAALAVGWLQAILWSTSNSRGLQAVSSLASFAVLLFVLFQIAAPGRPASGWFHEGLSTSHVLMFGLAAMVCVAVGTAGFATLRRGGGLDVDRMVDWSSRLFPKRARPAPFASPASAQFWLEWTHRGYIMPVGTLLIGVAVLVFTSVVPLDVVAPRDVLEFVGGISMILLIPALVIGIYLGGRSENGQFGNFGGSRPLTDGQVANAVLASATVGLFEVVLIWAVFMAVALLVLEGRTGRSSFESVINQLASLQSLGFATLGVRLLGFVTLGMGAVWGAVCLMTSLSLAGKRVSSVVVCSVMGGWIVGVLGPRLLLSRELQTAFFHVIAPVCVLLPLVCLAAAFVTGWWLKLMSRNTLLLAAAIVAAMFAAVHFAGFTREPRAYLAALWACSLTPSALAAAPLAVWWNRHR